MADSSLVVAIAQTDPLNSDGRDGKELLREVYNHIGGLLGGVKRAGSVVVIADGAALVSATNGVSCSSVEVADTVTIDSIVFTAAAAEDIEEGEFDQSGTDAETATSLAACINASAARCVASAGSSGAVALTATTPGVAGNGIPIESSNGLRLPISGGSAFAGGTGGDGTRTVITL